MWLRLLSEFPPHGDITINDLELAALLSHIHLLSPHVVPLSHICTVAYNTAAQFWDNRGRVKTLSSVGPILQEIALLACQWHLYTSIERVRGEGKNMADAASCITHLLYRLLLRHFNLALVQQKPWRLTPLPSA